MACAPGSSKPPTVWLQPRVERPLCHSANLTNSAINDAGCPPTPLEVCGREFATLAVDTPVTAGRPLSVSTKSIKQALPDEACVQEALQDNGCLQFYAPDCTAIPDNLALHSVRKFYILPGSAKWVEFA